jgi:Arm DNA-binding domain/Phage integrase, N-terminal SAM-like domain
LVIRQSSRFTEAIVAALPVDGSDRITFDALLPGFGVRVTPAGTKLFIAQAHVAGRPRRLTLGVFPKKSVAAAREDARAALFDMRAGRDPMVEKVSRTRAIEAGQVTVSAFADRWYAEYVEPKLKPRTASDYRRLLDRRIKPALGHIIVGRVEKEDVLKFHADMRAVPRRANYAVAVFRALMTYAEDCRLRPTASNPARRVKLYRENKRERFLSEDELRKAAVAITATERAKKIGPTQQRDCAWRFLTARAPASCSPRDGHKLIGIGGSYAYLTASQAIPAPSISARLLSRCCERCGAFSHISSRAPEKARPIAASLVHGLSAAGVPGLPTSDCMTSATATPATSNRLGTVTTGTNVRSFTYLNNGATSDDVRDPSNDYGYTFNNAARLKDGQRHHGRQLCLQRAGATRRQDRRRQHDSVHL